MAYARRITIALSAALVAGALALAGCTQPTKAPVTEPTTPSTTATPTATPTPAATLDPNGSAEQNLAYFRLVGHAKFGHKQNLTGKTVIDDLVAAGFDKKAMEITPDRTSIGLQAWNIEFSVKMNNTCLIGQVGNVNFQSFAAPLLASGKCLIGKTRTINF